MASLTAEEAQAQRRAISGDAISEVTQLVSGRAGLRCLAGGL